LGCAQSPRNLKRHGVSFEEAATAFADPNGLDYDDIEHSESELRSVRIGFSPIGRILFVGLYPTSEV
jgi:uncharacterized protein